MSGRRAPLVGTLVADTASLTGTRISMVALPWFVLTTTSSATLTGLVAAASLGPQVVAQALAGPLVDRLGARRVAVTAEALSVLTLVTVPLLHVAGLLTIPVLAALAALTGALRGPADSARHALLPALAEHAGVPIERVTGLQSSVERTASLVGAGLGGLVVAGVGAPYALGVSALASLVAAVLLAATTRTLRVRRPAERLGYGRELAEGFGFLRRDPVLLGLCLMIAVTNLIDQAYAAVLLPAFIEGRGLSAAYLGLVLSTMSGFAIVGALLAAAYGARMPRFATYLVAFTLAGAPRFVALGLDSPLAVVLATTAVGGFAAGFLNPIIGAVVFERTPEPMIGRVSSMVTATAWSLMPLGGVVAGGLVAGLGLGPALLVCGAAYFAATTAPALAPRFREMDRAPADGRHESAQAMASGSGP